MLDDRDIRLLDAIDQLGPDIPHVLLYHPATDGFDSFDDVEARIEVLEEAGYLRARSNTDGAGEPLTEYDTVPGWSDCLESEGLEPPTP